MNIIMKFMKKQLNSWNCRGILALVCGISFCHTGLASTQKLIINGSNNINLSDQIEYDYSTQPRKIIVESAAPLICQSMYDSTNLFELQVYDSNGTTPTDLSPGILQSYYSPSQNAFIVNTDASIQCADKHGMIFSAQSPGGANSNLDIIYGNGFNGGDVDVELNISPATMTSVSDGQLLSYQLNVLNNGTSEAVVDIIDFYNSANGGVPYLEDGSWSCQHSAGNEAVNCGNASGNGTAYLEGAILGAGESLTVQISREANTPVNTLGKKIKLLAAAFVRFEDSQNMTVKESNVNNNSDFTTLVVTDNQLPQISKIVDQQIDEGGQLLNVPFTVSDNDFISPNNFTYSATSSDQNVVPDSSITIGGTGFNRTLSIVPPVDQNTADDPVEITVQVVDDAGGLAIETFSLEINPINDPPSFNFSTPSIAHPVGTSGLQGPITGFMQNLVMGPTQDENQFQDVQNITIQLSGDNIFANINGSEPTFSNTGILTYILSGQSGTATVSVTIQDDGGTANGGNDTSATLSFDIVVANGNPQMQLTKGVYTGHDGGASCQLASSFVSVNTGDAVTFCYTLVNTGDTYLGNISITDDFNLQPVDPNINVTGISDLTQIGSSGFPIAPNAQVVWYYEATIGTDELQSKAEASANPETSNGTDLNGLNNVVVLSNDVLANL